jgi:hypothetical protein
MNRTQPLAPSNRIIDPVNRNMQELKVNRAVPVFPAAANSYMYRHMRAWQRWPARSGSQRKITVAASSRAGATAQRGAVRPGCGLVLPPASHGDAHPLGPGHLRGPPATSPMISARPSLGDEEEAREGRRGAEH